MNQKKQEGKFFAKKMKDNPQKEKIINLLFTRKRQGKKAIEVIREVEEKFDVLLSPSEITYYLKNHYSTESKIGRLKEILDSIEKLFQNKKFLKLFHTSFLAPIPLEKVIEELSHEGLHQAINTINTKDIKIFKKLEFDFESGFKKSKGGRRGRTTKYLYVDLTDFYKKIVDLFHFGPEAGTEEVIELINHPFFRINYFNEMYHFSDPDINIYSFNTNGEGKTTDFFTGILKKYLNCEDAFYDYLTLDFSKNNICEIFQVEEALKGRFNKKYSNFYMMPVQKAIKKNRALLMGHFSRFTSFRSEHLTDSQMTWLGDDFMEKACKAITVKHPALPLTKSNTRTIEE